MVWLAPTGPPLGAAGMRSTNWRVPNSGISALYSWPSL
jgi:hypothetical protein